ncbi:MULTISPECIES: FAD-dependent oxidoreductase [unclassified Roseitalea]|uniref:FAD-dependent oxidoreductase n=1 Tax=unclassified Roseitalea TaxID=2639107 RepID=UPI00273E1EDA|nr:MULTISPECIES: FAD-dependent oxidoreductase [unclassified Roseitalea]
MKPGHFDFEGDAVPALPGDTIAAALARKGHRVQRVARSGEPRGTFCGIGLCHECLVEVDGRSAQRACMTPARDVGAVRRHVDGGESALGRLAAPPQGGEPPTRSLDLAVVGAGPAGVSAALAAAGHGLRVALIDERPKAGGQYFKPPPQSSDGARNDRQHRAGDDLRARLADADIEHWTDHAVWFARRQEDGVALGLIGEGRARLALARAVIVATGAYERPAMVPGWTLPGVMTIGAAQSMIRSYGAVPGRRIAIAGNGPLGLQLAAELIGAGVPPLVLAERASPGDPRGLPRLLRAAWHAPGLVADGVRLRGALMRAGVPTLTGWQLARCHGAERLEAVSLEPVGGGAERRFDVDLACIGEGFLPQAEIARMIGCACAPDARSGLAVPERDDDGASSVPGVWIAGDGGGLGGAQVALAQGTIAGAEAARWLGGPRVNTSPARAGLRRARGFQRMLWSLYDAPPRAEPADETLLCRCESVSFGAARRAISDGAADLGALKRVTRLGMGRCQGRYCSEPAARLLGSGDVFAPQPPSRPVPVAALAIEKPEWGGHRKTEAPAPRATPERAPDAPPLPATTELLVIGAGVMGVAAALRATELGMETVVVDRGSVNGQSSGGNAGSLHMQLLSFDFGAKTMGRSDALLQTLPLQRDGIALWKQLERELDADFEIAETGGLMLAEEESQIGFLKDKVAAEKRVGIAVEVIGRQEIAAIAPAVSSRMVAAAWCAGEGKINPLLATPALARAARSNGAHLVEHVAVTAIEAEDTGYRVTTSAGTITARRLILAAGGWTGALGAMLGAPLPVSGAPLQMIVTETAPALAPCLLAHADRHLTMKQAAAGNVIIGGAWSAGTDGQTGRARVLRESVEGNLWVAERVLPALSGLHMLRCWGAMNVDIDGAPIIGPLPGRPDCVAVAGANGYTLGPLLGRIAAETIHKGALDTAHERFSPARFGARQSMRIQTERGNRWTRSR